MMAVTMYEKHCKQAMKFQAFVWELYCKQGIVLKIYGYKIGNVMIPPENFVGLKYRQLIRCVYFESSYTL